MKTFTALLASAFPRPLWSDMASPPGLGGGLYVLQLLNFIMMMLNGLLGMAIAKVLEVMACLFWYDSSAPKGDFHSFLFFSLACALFSWFFMYGPFHVLNANFWTKVTTFFAWGTHLGFHFTIPFLAVLGIQQCCY